MSHPVTIPLLNPNEPEAVLVGLHVHEGQKIAQGDLLCTLETTKSAAEVTAERSGYVVGLRHTEGQTVLAGEILCYLAEKPDWQIPAPDQEVADAHPQAGEIKIPADLRITQPALALARQRGINLNELPTGPLITESVLQEHLKRVASQESIANTAIAENDLQRPAASFDPTAIIIYGGGGHGKSLIDMLRVLGIYRLVGIIDDGLPPGDSIMGVPVLGDHTNLAELYSQGIRLAVNAVGGIGNIRVRTRVFNQLAAAGFVCPALVHPTAFVEPSASLSPGVQVFPQAYIGSEAEVGFGAIVNTGAIVSHDCRLGDFVNLSPGAILAGEVQVGTGALIGMGATVNLQARIGAHARIGNNATVKRDVPEGAIVRAGSVWPD